jgi:hypothetical protein
MEHVSKDMRFLTTGESKTTMLNLKTKLSTGQKRGLTAHWTEKEWSSSSCKI